MTENCRKLRKFLDDKKREREKGSSEKRARPDDLDIVYFNCGHVGHKSTECNAPPSQNRGGRGGYHAGRGGYDSGRGRGGRGYNSGRGGGGRGRGGYARNVQWHDDQSFSDVPPDNPLPPANYVQYDDYGGHFHHPDNADSGNYSRMVSNLIDNSSSVALRSSNMWVFDPACSFHLAWDPDYFQSLELHDDRMRAANATPLVIQGVGKAGTVPNVRLAPEVDVNLYSHPQAKRDGDVVTLSTDQNHYFVQTPDGRKMDFQWNGHNWVWYDVPPISAPPVPSTPTVSMVFSPAVLEFLTLHFRFAHLNYGYIYHAIEDGNWIGFRHSLAHIHLDSLPRCPVCDRAKFKLQPVSHDGRYIQISPGLLFHMDMKTIAVRSRHGHYHYFVGIIDDNSHRSWVYFMRKKTEALFVLKTFINEACTPAGITRFALRMDNAGEYVSHEMERFCVEHDIHRVPTPAYRQAYNGVVERFFDIVMNMVRAMLLVAHFHNCYWNWAVILANIIRNCCPRGPHGKTPIFLWGGLTPDVNAWFIFGSRATIPDNQHVKTTDPPGQEVRYLGPVEYSSKFHNFLRLSDGRVFTSDVFTMIETDMQDQSFHGNMAEEMAGLKNLTVDQKAIVDSHADRESDQSWEELKTRPDLAEKFDDDDKSDSDDDDETDTESIASTAAVFLAHPFPPTVRSIGCTLPPPRDLNEVRSGSPMRGPATAAYSGNACEAGRGPHVSSTTSKTRAPHSSRSSGSSKYCGVAKFITFLAACYAVTTPTEVPVPEIPSVVQIPQSHSEAERSEDAEHWLEGEREEISAFFDNNVWKLVPIPSNYRLLTSKWVYNFKLHPAPRYRSRLTLKGFLQREGVDYGDIFSPVVRYSTVRIVFALCAHYRLHTRHLDCPKAFTQADLDVPIYIKAPPGMKIPAGMCLKILKSIYGLKQASRLFHELLTEFLVSIGFTKCDSDPCLFFIVTDDDMAIICLYVDDLLLCSASVAFGDILTAKLTKKFNTNDLGPVSHMLGMRVTISPCRTVYALDLEEYILKIIKRFGFEDKSSFPTPMLHTVKLTAKDCPDTDETKAEMLQYPFRPAIACLMFAMVVMRVDISFAVISCARFSANPGLNHWLAVCRIYRYLIGTSGLKLTYSRIIEDPAPLMYGRSDADWATSDVDERRTVIGYIVMLSGAAILWSTRFWKPCLSIHEGEFGAATELVREVIGAHQLLRELPLSYDETRGADPITCLTDSRGTALVANNPKAHSTSKHCHIREAWMQGMVKDGFVRIQWDERENNTADGLVKAKPKAEFRSDRDHSMGPYHDLVVKMTAGESLRKRKADQLEE